MQRIFAQIFPNFPKGYRATCTDRFLVWTQKNGLRLFFCKRWAPFFEVKQRWGPFLPRFSAILPRYLGILPGFQQIKTFGVALASPFPTPLIPNLARLLETKCVKCVYSSH